MHSTRALTNPPYPTPTLQSLPDSMQPYSIQALEEELFLYISRNTNEAVHLVGHDWGAVISQQFSINHPTKLLSLTTLAIPFNLFSNTVKFNPTQLISSSYMIPFQLPHPLPEMALINHGGIERLFKTWSPTWNERERSDYVVSVKDKLANRSAITAALHYYRSNVGLASTIMRFFVILLTPILPFLKLGVFSSLLKFIPETILSALLLHELKLSNVNKDLRPKILQLGGATDGCVQIEMFKLLKNDSDANYMIIENAGHW